MRKKENTKQSSDIEQSGPGVLKKSRIAETHRTWNYQPSDSGRRVGTKARQGAFVRNLPCAYERVGVIHVRDQIEIERPCIPSLKSQQQADRRDETNKNCGTNDRLRQIHSLGCHDGYCQSTLEARRRRVIDTGPSADSRWEFVGLSRDSEGQLGADHLTRAHEQRHVPKRVVSVLIPQGRRASRSNSIAQIGRGLSQETSAHGAVIRRNKWQREGCFYPYGERKSLPINAAPTFVITTPVHSRRRTSRASGR